MDRRLHIVLALFLCGYIGAGCSSYGYRRFADMDDRLRGYPYIGREWVVDKTETRVRYVDANCALLNQGEPYSQGWVDTETVPGGKDSWMGIGVELGYGHKYILRNSDESVLWGSLEAHYMALRFTYHLSGPKGKPDHNSPIITLVIVVWTSSTVLAFSVA